MCYLPEFEDVWIYNWYKHNDVTSYKELKTRKDKVIGHFTNYNVYNVFRRTCSMTSLHK